MKNNIQTIQSMAFYNLPKLETVYLDGNPIKFIEPNAFYNCTNLIEIWLPVNNLGKNILDNLLKTINNFVVKNSIDVQYFKTIHLINSDKIDKKFCNLMIYFLRYRVTLIHSESYYNIPWDENENYNVHIKRLFYYLEELNIQHFLNNCLNLNITQSDKFEILDIVQFSDRK